MAKRVAKPKDAPAEPVDGSVAFQVRLDADLHARLKEAAETAGISMNQLIQGTLRGAMEYLVQGEADMQAFGWVRQRKQKGCVFFGRVGYSLDEEEVMEYRSRGEKPPEPDKGLVWFGLDYTNRGVVRYQPR